MKTIALDFDAVLHQYSGWNEGRLGEPILGAISAVESLLSRVNLVILTTRDPEVVTKWMEEKGFPFVPVTNQKGLYSVLLDDRVIQFKGVWNSKLLDDLINFMPYWETIK